MNVGVGDYDLFHYFYRFVYVFVVVRFHSMTNVNVIDDVQILIQYLIYGDFDDQNPNPTQSDLVDVDDDVGENFRLDYGEISFLLNLTLIIYDEG